MRICQIHWTMMRAVVDNHGMSSLVAKDGEAAMSNIVADLQGEPDPNKERFDPLMSMHWHWTNSALKNGGLYLLSPQANGEPHCPICEFANHYADFDALTEIEKVGAQMAIHCRENGLIAGLQ